MSFYKRSKHNTATRDEKPLTVADLMAIGADSRPDGPDIKSSPSLDDRMSIDKQAKPVGDDKKSDLKDLTKTKKATPADKPESLGEEMKDWLYRDRDKETTRRKQASK